MVQVNNGVRALHAFGHQRGDQEVVAVQRIGEHHIARAKPFEQAAHQAKFTTPLALVRPPITASSAAPLATQLITTSRTRGKLTPG